MIIIGGFIIVAFILLLLVLRGCGKANDVAEQQEVELTRQMRDAEAIRRITQ